MGEKGLEIAKELVEREGSDESRRVLCTIFLVVGSYYVYPWERRNLRRVREMCEKGLEIAKELVERGKR